MPKPKIAFYWCASCGGCEEAVVDLAGDILKVVEAVDIVFWPVALDFKRKDVEAMPAKSIAVAFINGAVRTSEQKEMVELLREKANLVVAFGSCAHIGGVPGLANVSDRKGIFDRVYFTESTDNEDKVVPQPQTECEFGELRIPEFYDTVNTLAQTIDVDYFLPGCAPPPDLIMSAIEAILSGELPPKGSVLAPNKALCNDCPRKESKPEKLFIEKFNRVSEVTPSADKCFLEQGLICMGPATRDGCGNRCINANMPCRGCFGPTDEVRDQGAKFISAIASCYDTDDPEVAKSISDGILDTIGVLYMYGLPASLLRRKVNRG